MTSVWRNTGTSALDLSGIRSAQAEVILDDDSCDICMGEDGACDIWFSPCGHKACASCVQKMRIANVYKADKGVRCPFCRQVIESYLDAPPPRRSANSPFPPESASFALVMGGNLEAGSKAVGEIRDQYGRGGIVSIGGGNDYLPPKGVTGSDGGGLRSSTRMDELLPGYVVPPLKDTDDIVSMAMDRTGARHLDFMLREGYVKRHKVAKLCREMLTPYAAKLAIHASGNYVLQRMLEYAATHRGEGGNAESFFTAIVRSFSQDKGLVMAAQDHRGTFSVQKMLVSLKGAEEATLVAHCIRGSVVTLALDQYGVYVLERLVEALITSLNPAQGKKPRVPPKVAGKILAQICEEMQADSKSLASIAKHHVNMDNTVSEACRLHVSVQQSKPDSEEQRIIGYVHRSRGDLSTISRRIKVSHRRRDLLIQPELVCECLQVSGIMLVECIRWALPQGEAMEAAMGLADMAGELVGSKLAHRTLQGILSLEIKEVAEHVIQGLQGRYVELASDTIGFGFKLVRACLATPCVGESMRLLVVDELLNAVIHPSGHHSLIDNSAGCDTFAFGLCLLTRRVLDERLDPLLMYLERDKFLHFREGVESMRKLFFIETLPPNAPHGSSSAPTVPTVPTVTRVRSLDLTSKPDLPSNSIFGLPRSMHNTVVSDPWSEEGPSTGVFSTEHTEKPLTRVASLPHSRPSTPGSRLLATESILAGDSSSQGDRHFTHTTASSSDGTLFTRTSMSSTYTIPHLREKGLTSSVSSTQTGLLSPQTQLTGTDGVKGGSYAPPHLRHSSSTNVTPPTGFSDVRYEMESSSTGSFGNGHIGGDSLQGASSNGGQVSLPYGSADFLNDDKVSAPGFAAIKKSSEQEKAGNEIAKVSGGHRQPGICAVCNRDAANTVLLDCSHMCCCTSCSRNITMCPICNNKVTGVIDIRPVGMPPSPSSAPQPQLNGSSHTWGTAPLSKGATTFATSSKSLDIPSAVSQSREEISRPSSVTTQFQGTEPPLESALSPRLRAMLGPQYSFRTDQPPPGIPVPRATTNPPISRITSSQIQSSISLTPVPSFSSAVGRPLYLPSEIFPTSMTGVHMNTSGSDPSSLISSSFTLHAVPPPPGNNTYMSLQSTGSYPVVRRPPAPYRPPGMYRPPDLFARPASSAVVTQASSILHSDFTSVVPPQWRTY